MEKQPTITTSPKNVKPTELTFIEFIAGENKIHYSYKQQSVMFSLWWRRYEWLEGDAYDTDIKELLNRIDRALVGSELPKTRVIIDWAKNQYIYGIVTGHNRENLFWTKLLTNNKRRSIGLNDLYADNEHNRDVIDSIEAKQKMINQLESEVRSLRSRLEFFCPTLVIQKTNELREQQDLEKQNSEKQNIEKETK